VVQAEVEGEEEDRHNVVTHARYAEWGLQGFVWLLQDVLWWIEGELKGRIRYP
jgi:hypothetical protein